MKATTSAEKTDRHISRDHIKSCAVELFESHGVDETSVNQIVRRAGIAKGTFYLYFKTKDVLIDEVFDRYTTSFFDAVVAPNGADPRVKSFSSSIIEYFSRNTMFLEELRRSLFSKKRYHYTERTSKALSAVILNYLNLNERYPITQLDTYSQMIIGMILEICHRLLVDGSIKSREEAQLMLEDFLKRFFDCEQFFA